MRKLNFALFMVIGAGSGYYGYSKDAAIGTLERVAKQGQLMPADIRVDANGDCRLITNTDEYDAFGDEVEIVFDGYDVNIPATTGMSDSYGKPIRMKWDAANDFYSTAGLSGARTDLYDWFEAKVDTGVYCKILSYRTIA